MPDLEIRVVPGHRVGPVGARLVREALVAAGRPDATLMPALGTSALPIYAELGRARAAGLLPVPDLRLIQLDEYAGIGKDDDRSLFRWLARDVAGPLGVPEGSVVRLGGGRARDPDAACRRYDRAVSAAGGVDVAVLGLGPNGHIGFNEPPTNRDDPTRLVRLTPASLTSNARYWPGRDVPTEALTAGMGTILAARRVILVVTGRGKQAILRQTLAGSVGPQLPASWLRTMPGVTLLADEDAWPSDLPIRSSSRLAREAAGSRAGNRPEAPRR